MKKERILKYLILICSMTISFFIFTNFKVSAIDNYEVNDGKIILEMEETAGGYVIAGASTTCLEGDFTCIKDWEMPSSYSGLPILGIKDSDNNQKGVMENISKVVSGRVTLGEEFTKIGKCAFCNFSYVKEIKIGKKVTNINDYAFAYNDLLEDLVIDADNLNLGLSNSNIVNRSSSFARFIFKNKGIADQYKTKDVWKDIAVSFTFGVKYRFFDEANALIKTVEFYNNETIGDKFPAYIEKTGLNSKWVYYYNGEEVEITRNSQVGHDRTDSELGPIRDIFPSWSLKEASISFDVGFNGDSTINQNNVEVTYGGKEKKLELIVNVNHDLMGVENFVSYSWKSNRNGINHTNLSSTNSISIFRVFESGLYTCDINFLYIDNEKKYTGSESIQINVSILPKKLILNVLGDTIEYGNFVEGFEDKSGVSYTIDRNNGLTENEIIKSVRFEGYNLESNVGEYTALNLNKSTLNIGYENDLDNYVENYDVQINKGTLTIIPRNVELVLDGDLKIEYGSEELLLKEATTNIFGEDRRVIIEYFRKDSSNDNVGEYEVSDARVLVDGEIDHNYAATLSRENVGKIIIFPKKVDVEWNIDSDLVYNGSEKFAEASYVSKEGEIPLNVSITKDSVESYFVNAGKYTLVASMKSVNKNYELVGFEIEKEIDRAESEFLGADGKISKRQNKIYNGKPQRVDVYLNHNEGTISYGDYSSCINVHFSDSDVCTISVSVERTENYYEKSKNIDLHIDPYKLMVSPGLFEYTYGSQIGVPSKIYDGVNGEKVTVYFYREGGGIAVDTILDAGYYNIEEAYLENTSNYVVEMTGSGENKIKINPSPITVEFYHYENLVYDGKVKNVTPRPFGILKKDENKDIIKIDYGEKNIIKNAGDYRIDVSVINTDNYYIEGKSYLEFSISKARYDVSKLKLKSSKNTFNFKNHFIKLEGDMPEGLKASYTIDGKSGNGTFLPFKHTVKVTFDGDFENYYKVEPFVATLNVSMTWVWVVLAAVIFIGVIVPVTFVILIKCKVIKFRKRIKRRVIKNLIKKSRELDSLNEMLRLKKNAVLNKEQEDVEIIEEPVKFIKKPVNTEPEELIEMSFVDELFRASYGTKEFYSEVKNELLSYDGVVNKIKRDYETFYLKNIPIAKLDVVDGVLYAYFALDPTMYKEEQYKHENVSKEKDFVAVPMKIKVNSIDSLRYAKMFIRIIRKREGLKFVSNFVRTDYVSVYTAKENAFKMFKKAFVKKGTKEYEED